MGSGGSKGYCDGASPGSGSGGSRRKGKCIGRKVFQSSCLGSRGDYVDDVCDRGSKENGGNATSTNRTKIESDQEKKESLEKVKVEQSDGMPCISSSNEDLTGWSQARVTNTGFRTGSSSARAASNQSLPSPSRFFSRFSFIPGNLSFRLSRASSLGSSRAYRVPSSSLRILDDDDYEETNIFSRSANGIGNGSGTRQSGDLFATSVASRIPSHDHEDSSTSFQLRTQSSDFLDNMQDNQTMSFTHHVAGDGGNTVVGIDRNLHSPIIFGDLDGNETRASDRGVGLREPVERNVRFSRTLSVGRLRDRVLRQPSASDLTFCPFQQGREVRDSGQGRRRALGSDVRVSESEGISLTSPTASGNPLSSMSSSLFNFQAHAMETSQSREARYHDLLEHRSNFLERRRRIRSQVRALQRLGGRFENLSGHERSCILSGQHRTGRCTCRVSNRDANLNDDTSARASISRIVMLADALFEVLDEIHQQSVVLSSRPSVSSLGSVPAPNEVVESLPVRLYSKSQKHQYEETAQCYICLVEYEEGDSMRVLPCDHEFHRTCVDKWLKEIHRVCPLCRGDICRSDYSLPAADN